MPTSKPILCGSIAGSIGGLGIRMHNAAFQALGLPYTYVSFEPSDAKGAIQAMRALGIRGLGVTMPFKEKVVEHLDHLDDISKEIGAVNTIVNDDGILTGYNTDGYGAIATLLEATDLTGKRCAVLGAGGGGKTIAWALKAYTDQIVLYNRSAERGQAAADKFHIQYGGNLDEVGIWSYDVLINCTSVGFKSDLSPLTATQLRPGAVLMDIVFSPAVTTLQKQALSQGMTVLPGTRMIMHQALKQFALYTGVEAPQSIYEQAILASIAGK